MCPFLRSPQHTHLNFQLAPIPQVQFWPQPSQRQHPKPLTAAHVIFVGKQGTAFASVSSVRHDFSRTILRNDQGRITWPDGSNIARGFNENILTAVNRELASRTKSANLIRATTTTQEVGPISKDDYIVHNGQVFVAVWGKENRAQGRKPMKTQTKDDIWWNSVTTNASCTQAYGPDSTRAQIVLPPPLATYEQPLHHSNPFDDDEIMEDVSSDASTDSTTFPVKKTPKRPKQPTKPSKPQPVIPSIPNDSIQISIDEERPSSETAIRTSAYSQCWHTRWQSIGDPDNDHLGELLGAAPMHRRSLGLFADHTPSKFIQKEELVKDKPL